MFIDKNGTVRKPVCYLAGFEMFYPDGAEQGKRNMALCEKYGIIGLFPAEPEPDDDLPRYVQKDDSVQEWEKMIFHRDVNHMRRSDMIIANLNDFRGGNEPDSGTAFECGFCYGLGHRLYAFIDDARPMVERFNGEKHQNEQGRWVDKDGAGIEDFGDPLNLMFNVPMTIVEGGIEQALQRARADFDKELIAAGHKPYTAE